jgi:curved DNA-binding protein CbpA
MSGMQQTVMDDPYRVLGVSRDADSVTIKRAYREQAKRKHPDQKGGSKEEFETLTKAYNLLRDPKSRREFDEWGKTEPETEGEEINKAYTRIVTIIMEFLNSMQNTDPTSINWIDLVQRRLLEEEAKVVVFRQDADKRADRLQKMADRFKRKKEGGNRLQQVFQQFADDQRLNANRAEEGIAHFRLAMELVREYEFDVRRHDRPSGPLDYLNQFVTPFPVT